MGADFFVKVLGNPKAANQIYNVAGDRFVTFDGIAKACALAMGVPEPELVHYNPKDFDFGKKKAFPMRDQHFFASVDKAKTDLGWSPKYGLVDGLKDSYDKVRDLPPPLWRMHDGQTALVCKLYESHTMTREGVPFRFDAEGVRSSRSDGPGHSDLPLRCPCIRKKEKKSRSPPTQSIAARPCAACALRGAESVPALRERSHTRAGLPLASCSCACIQMFYHLRFTVSLRVLELVQDFGLGMCRKEADFETDDMILAKLK